MQSLIIFSQPYLQLILSLIIPYLECFSSFTTNLCVYNSFLVLSAKCSFCRLNTPYDFPLDTNNTHSSLNVLSTLHPFTWPTPLPSVTLSSVGNSEKVSLISSTFSSPAYCHFSAGSGVVLMLLSPAC